MYPKLTIHTSTAAPVTVQPLTVDFEVYEELIGSKKATDSGLRLCIAFLHITGREPKTLTEVRTWGRENAVQVVIGDTPDPTQPVPSVE